MVKRTGLFLLAGSGSKIEMVDFIFASKCDFSSYMNIVCSFGTKGMLIYAELLFLILPINNQNYAELCLSLTKF